MNLLDLLKLKIIIFLDDGILKNVIKITDGYKKALAENPKLEDNIKALGHQILLNTGQSEDNPVIDMTFLGLETLLNILDFGYVKLNSELLVGYNYFIQQYEISNRVNNPNETIILYYKVYTNNQQKINLGIEAIDHSSLEFRFNDVVFVGSAPSMGVSSFLYQQACQLSLIYSVYFVVNTQNIHRVEQALRQYNEMFYSSKMPAGLNIVEVDDLALKTARRIFKHFYHGVVIIDDYNDNMFPTIEQLKQIAKKQGLFVFLGSTLKVSTEKRGLVSFPVKKDLRFSKKDIDLLSAVLLINRPFYYDVAEDKSKIMIYVHSNSEKYEFELKLQGEKLQRILS
jgi:hypothetical protein